MLKARNVRNKDKSVYTIQFWNTYISYLRMSKKLAIFDFPQNTPLRLHQKSDAKTKYSYPPSITNSNNLFGPFKQQDASSPSFLLPLDVMDSTSRREQSAVQAAPEFRIVFLRSQIYTADQISFAKKFKFLLLRI